MPNCGAFQAGRREFTAHCNDHVNTDMVFSDFMNICKAAWREKQVFIVIDKDSSV